MRHRIVVFSQRSFPRTDISPAAGFHVFHRGLSEIAVKSSRDISLRDVTRSASKWFFLSIRTGGIIALRPARPSSGRVGDTFKRLFGLARHVDIFSTNTPCNSKSVEQLKQRDRYLDLARYSCIRGSYRIGGKSRQVGLRYI